MTRPPAPRPLLLLAAGILCACAALAPAADWLQWRGPGRTDVATETGLLKAWPKGGPRLVWRYDGLGLGYSGFAVQGSRLFTMGAREDREMLLAIDLAKPAEAWATPMGDRLDNDWGDGPRGTPTIDGEQVFALSGRGVLVCAQKKDGKVLWTKTMESLGGDVPKWGYTESVLVDGNRVVCTPGGRKGAIAALDRKSGDVLWQSKEFTDDAQYSSIVKAEIHGKPQYVQLTMKSVVGIAPADGKLLWKGDWPGTVAVIPTPIVADNHVYVTSGYGVGSKLFKIGADNKATEVYFEKAMKNHHGGVIKVGSHLYGHSDGAGWTCQDFATGKAVWQERSALGKGAVAYADGRLYCLSEKDGAVALVEASPDGWKEHGRLQLEPLSDRRSPRGGIWTHPVVSNGKLYLRDQENLYCYDVKAR